MFGKFVHSMHGHSFYNSLFRSSLKFLPNSFSVIKKNLIWLYYLKNGFRSFRHKYPDKQSEFT